MLKEKYKEIPCSNYQDLNLDQIYYWSTFTEMFPYKLQFLGVIKCQKYGYNRYIFLNLSDIEQNNIDYDFDIYNDKYHISFYDTSSNLDPMFSSLREALIPWFKKSSSIEEYKEKLEKSISLNKEKKELMIEFAKLFFNEEN